LLSGKNIEYATVAADITAGSAAILTEALLCMLNVDALTVQKKQCL
jgi:hypothetical protein